MRTEPGGPIQFDGEVEVGGDGGAAAAVIVSGLPCPEPV